MARICMECQHMQCYRCCQRSHLETTSDMGSQEAYFSLEQMLAVGNNLCHASTNEAILTLAQQAFANNISVLQTGEQPLQIGITAPHIPLDVWA